VHLASNWGCWNGINNKCVCFIVSTLSKVSYKETEKVKRCFTVRLVVILILLNVSDLVVLSSSGCMRIKSIRWAKTTFMRLLSLHQARFAWVSQWQLCGCYGYTYWTCTVMHVVIDDCPQRASSSSSSSSFVSRTLNLFIYWRDAWKPQSPHLLAELRAAIS
jgi:hypothetical protein